MPRSNSPQALSVVAVTIEGDAPATAQNITQFDDVDIPFNHEPTWSAMPKALQGVLDPTAVGTSLAGRHPRVRDSIVGLCDLGVRRPSATFSFKDHPSSGLKEVEGLRVSPAVTIVAKSTCWRVVGQNPVIQLLQPRLSGLTAQKQGLYFALGRRAFCRGDWAQASLEIVDLSLAYKDGSVHARVIQEHEVPLASEDDLNNLVATYLQGQELAAAIRAERGPVEKKRRKRDDRSGDLFGG